MKSRSILGLAATVLALTGIDQLFARAVFARWWRLTDPFKRRSRSHGSPDRAHCRQCNRMVSRNRKHRCIAPFIPSPPHGYRWQSGKLVSRARS